MSDLKKKIIDILYEPEPESEIQEPEEEFVRAEAVEEVNESPIRAKDILYHKNSENSVFVNVDNTANNFVGTKEDEKQEYEFSSQISPIFGVIEQGKKRTINVTPEIIEAQTTKPADSHLDIITSPIYGYGSKEEAMDNNYDVKAIGDDEEEELHHLFDEHEQFTEANPNSDDDEISLFRLFGENK